MARNALLLLLLATTTLFATTLAATPLPSNGRCELFFHQDVRSPALVRKFVPSATYIYLSAEEDMYQIFSDIDDLQILVDIIPRVQCRNAFTQVMIGSLLPWCVAEVPQEDDSSVVRVCRRSCELLVDACLPEERTLIETAIAELGLTDYEPFNCDNARYVQPTTTTTTTATIETPFATTTTTPAAYGHCRLIYTGDDTQFEAEAPHARCVEYTGDVCKGVISGRVYVRGGECLADVENRLSVLPTALLLTSSDACAAAMARVICHTYYMACDETTVVATLSSMDIALPTTTTTTSQTVTTTAGVDAATQRTTQTTRETTATLTESIVPTYPLPRYPDVSLCNAYQVGSTTLVASVMSNPYVPCAN
jgi:hypothetical protein